MRLRVLLMCAVAIALAGAVELGAHHSFSATYRLEPEGRDRGPCEGVRLANPHSFMRLDVTGKDGATNTWTLEWGSTNDLTQAESRGRRSSLATGSS